ncbi:MAG: ATP-dependent DNA helicase [Flavobacteriaceae bacterium]|nr:ATP-dependent DNA helicase [Flavobacteriaceae bacterium]
MNKDFSHLSELNESQLAPVIHKEGPMIVVAGAGSGKTRVLTHRIINLMLKGVDPFSILALTFTNKAAREMKERIISLVGSSEAKNIWMGTFHSIFARILRNEAEKLGYTSRFTIYDTQDSDRIISSIIKDFLLDKDLYKYKEIRNRISMFKNNLITVNAYENNSDLVEYDLVSRRPKMGEIYKEYVERCFRSDAMDFDDLLLKTNELLNLYPEVLAKYQNQFRYILVDEYQDTNHSQYIIIKALSDKFQNICVVGDDAQSIYSFRGANIRNIIDFQKDYSDVKIYRLEQNYRSTKNIVNAANSVIKYNKNKIDKVVWTANGEGQKIKIRRCLTDGEEARYISRTIKKFVNQENKKNSDFVILYRTNAQSRSIEDAFRKSSIPYRIYGGLSFYQRKEIKDVLAYLRVIVNPNDEESFKRIINYPTRGIGLTTIDKIIVGARENSISFFEALERSKELKFSIPSKTLYKIENFLTFIKSLQFQSNKLNAFEMVEIVVKKTNFLEELKKESTIDSIAKTENVQELVNGMRDFVEAQREIVDSTGSLNEFLEDIALATDFDKNIENESDKVSLMTIHLAKGLEFPIVFIVGLEEDLFPSALSLSSRSDLEEERRLFYVALTRAKSIIFISYAQSRYRWGKLIESESSRFLKEIDSEYVEHEQSNDFELYNKFQKKQIRKKPLNFIGLNNKKKLSRVNSSENISNHSTNIISISEGDKVEHERFGIGIVIKIEGSGGNKSALINFKNSGSKKLLLRFAKLIPIK